MLILKRLESFCASHRLYHPKWSDAENTRFFGKCAHIHGHGHNYKLEVAVCGKTNPETGIVFNLTDLKQIIQDEVLVYVDHKHLNFDVPWLSEKIPTTEVLVEGIWDQLQEPLKIKGVTLHSVTVWETDKNIVTKQHVCNP